MERFKRILKRIFFLPPRPTVLVALFGYSFIILVAAFHIDIPALHYLAYISSAYALIVTITGFPHFMAFSQAVRQHINDSTLVQKLRGTAIGERFFSDVRFRSDLSLYQGFLINLLYIAMKLVSGIYYRVYWFVALAVYYMVLAVMRFILLPRRKKRSIGSAMEEEWRRYRLCGIMLLLMNQALMGIVIYMVRDNRGFDYPGLLIYLMALYAFYAVISAVIDLVKFRKHGSPVMSAAKAIRFVAALVSILSLETAMLAQFGGDDETFRAVMTGATGGGACVIVIGMAIYMIAKSTKNLRQFQN